MPNIPADLPSSAGIEHAHRWRIAEQGSRTSIGSCHCGVVQEFTNGWELGRRDWTPGRPGIEAERGESAASPMRNAEEWVVDIVSGRIVKRPRPTSTPGAA